MPTKYLKIKAQKSSRAVANGNKNVCIDMNDERMLRHGFKIPAEGLYKWYALLTATTAGHQAHIYLRFLRSTRYETATKF